jgi:serine/threonine protein kinase
MTNEDRIAELLLRWEEAFDHGQDLTAEELCVGTPELLEPLKQRIAALKQIAWVKEDAAAKQPPELHDVSLPKILADRYRIEGLIAEGGHGQVYRAFDQELQRLVAIKIARRKDVPDEDLLEEARKVARLRHPGIVAVHDVGRDSGTLFIVSDLIEGKNLAEVERPSVKEAVRIVADVADALHFAHQQGFIHRDIKPGNILLDGEGHPFVADFGIATTTEELVDGRSVSVGTLPFMSPEQVAGETQLIDRRTDIYALGVVLYELLTDTLPYQARTPIALREQILFRPPARFDDNVPEAVAAACLRCLAKHPADRYATAEELATELRASLTVPRKQSWRWLSVAGIVLLLVLAGLAGWNLIQSKDVQPTKTRTNDAALQTDQKVFLANGNEVWVMDNTATAIEYSFDQAQWKPVVNLVKTIVLRRGTIDDPRIGDQKATVYVRYMDHRGNQSQVYKIPVASVATNSPPKELGQPIDPSRFIHGTKPVSSQP